jgi:hypothetical protein
MNFAPAPPNDFAEFIETYFVRCRERVPQIEGNAGKWLFEDLIPGLSDFDTRFLVSDSMTATDWCQMSTEVGKVHLELVKERKDWARNLEHLPGVNLKWSELLDPRFYYTEFSQWSFYHGHEEYIQAIRNYIQEHQWSPKDELYHWEKIAIYYGPYNRTIDPPVNLGIFENKYPLHSRSMHYFAPPVHSAVCLMQRNTKPGKREAMQAATALFPNAQTMALVYELIARHYEAPEYLAEPGLTELDEKLEIYLREAVNTLLENSGALQCARDATPAQLKAAVAQLRAEQGDASLSKLFENVKFSRLMKGRLWFYGQEVLWFDSHWLIRIELNRTRSNFYETPLRLFAKLFYGQDVTPETALEMMHGDIFDDEEVLACRRFADLTALPCPDNQLKQRALQIAAIFDPFLHALEKLLQRALLPDNRN